jgi:hypothetical protein
MIPQSASNKNCDKTLKRGQQFPLRPNIPIRAMSEGSLGTI